MPKRHFPAVALSPPKWFEPQLTKVGTEAPAGITKATDRPAARGGDEARTALLRACGRWRSAFSRARLQTGPRRRRLKESRSAIHSR